MQACDLSDLSCLQQQSGAVTWVSELIWREFYHHIVYFYPDVCRHKPFRVKTDVIPWGHNEQLLEAWKKGMTGFPIVDAGMRQLVQTGWMHNRLGMIVAMFLSKILLQDWRLGEDILWST
jgi:deoxyribodipyrimidine photo-lyase